MTDSRSVATFPSFQEQEFWQQWQHYRDYLYGRCIKWMGGNLTDAEDALSRAMVKAWEKMQKYKEKIRNFKAWLTKLTHNLCIDIHRECDRRTNRVENIEAILDNQELVSFDDTPESAIETSEKKMIIRRAIDNLPKRLRETFILHFYQEVPYSEIAQQQETSYQNVCKRISQARAILRQNLREYFEDETDTTQSVTSTLAATESTTTDISQENEKVEAIASQKLTSSIVVDVETVVDEESNEAQVQQRESVTIAATADERLEVNSEGWFVETVLFETQFPGILSLLQLDKDTRSWGNPYPTVHIIKRQHQVGKLAREFLLPSRSPPLR
jgi:RNA polymerase sigma factor (sigma-70 family)